MSAARNRQNVWLVDGVRRRATMVSAPRDRAELCALLEVEEGSPIGEVDLGGPGGTELSVEGVGFLVAYCVPGGESGLSINGVVVPAMRAVVGIDDLTRLGKPGPRRLSMPLMSPEDFRDRVAYVPVAAPASCSNVRLVVDVDSMARVSRGSRSERDDV